MSEFEASEVKIMLLSSPEMPPKKDIAMVVGPVQCFNPLAFIFFDY